MRKFFGIALPILTCLVAVAWVAIAIMAIFMPKIYELWSVATLWQGGVILGVAALVSAGGSVALATTSGMTAGEILVLSFAGEPVKVVAKTLKKSIRKAVESSGELRCKKIELSAKESGELTIKIDVKITAPRRLDEVIGKARLNLVDAFKGTLGIAPPRVCFSVSGMRYNIEKTGITATQIDNTVTENLNDDAESTADVFSDMSEELGDSDVVWTTSNTKKTND